MTTIMYYARMIPAAEEDYFGGRIILFCLRKK
jgi:hypothetical protein